MRACLLTGVSCTVRFSSPLASALLLVPKSFRISWGAASLCASGALPESFSTLAQLQVLNIADVAMQHAVDTSNSRGESLPEWLQFSRYAAPIPSPCQSA